MIDTIQVSLTKQEIQMVRQALFMQREQVRLLERHALQEATAQALRDTERYSTLVLHLLALDTKLGDAA